MWLDGELMYKLGTGTKQKYISLCKAFCISNLLLVNEANLTFIV